jgi:hypothetical protein
VSFIGGVYTITLGGGLLVAGARASGTVSIPGARAGMHVTVTPQTDLGASACCGGYVSSNDTGSLLAIAERGEIDADCPAK